MVNFISFQSTWFYRDQEI